MKLEAALIVIIFLLVWYIIIKGRAVETTSKSWKCIDNSTGDIATVTVEQPKQNAPESYSSMENAEYFANCTTAADSEHLKSCGDKVDFAINEFGAPGMDYKDWVASQAVDPQVIKNHLEFIKDRETSVSQNKMGRTYSPDMHDSYDPVPWVGLRRPQAVPICNPTQVPDVNYDLYNAKPTFTWRSS